MIAICKFRVAQTHTLRMPKPRSALVLLIASLLAGCSTRYHLAGEADGGASAGTSGSAKGGTFGGSGGNGGTVAVGSGGAGATVSSGGTTAVPMGPVPLQIPAREAVTRVARVLWESLPDQALVQMADSGAVTTDSDVRRVALGMLADPRARVGVAHFYRWWLNLDALATTTKDAASFPEYSAALGTSMGAETEAFALDVTFDGDGRFQTLMRGSYSFLNEDLAKLYGVPGVTGSGLQKVNLDPTQRAGILTQTAFLTLSSTVNSWTYPTRRGYLVAEQIRCNAPPPPPPSGELPLSGPYPSQTNRQSVMQATADAACRACHSLFDSFGFAFEEFDSIGRLRLTDGGQPIDASGHIQRADGEHSWKNAVELAQFLADDPDAQLCIGRQWLRYLQGRELTDADKPSVVAIGNIFAASAFDLRTGIAAAVSSASFLAPTGGPPCTQTGVPQSCNDDIRISSIHGTCTASGKCVCTGTYMLNPATGRCL